MLAESAATGLSFCVEFQPQSRRMWFVSHFMPSCARETQAFMPQRPMNCMRYPITTAKTAKKAQVSNFSSNSFLDEVHVWRGFEAISSETRMVEMMAVRMPIGAMHGLNRKRTGSLVRIATQSATLCCSRSFSFFDDALRSRAALAGGRFWRKVSASACPFSVSTGRHTYGASQKCRLGWVLGVLFGLRGASGR